MHALHSTPAGATGSDVDSEHPFESLVPEPAQDSIQGRGGAALGVRPVFARCGLCTTLAPPGRRILCAVLEFGVRALGR